MAEEDLSAQDPFAKSIKEEEEAQKALLSRYQQLQSGLERRVSMPFDPTLMRISQALLSPTQSGTFGESLGKGVGALVEGSEAEALRQQNIMKMQAELEEKMLGIKQKGSQLQAIRQMAGYGAPAAVPAGAAPQAGATQTGVAQTGAGQPSGGGSVFDSALDQYGIQIMEPDPYYMKSQQQLVAELWNSGVKDPKEIHEQLRKIKKDRYEINPTGIGDRGTGKWMVFLSGKTGEYPITLEDGSVQKFDIDTSFASALSAQQPGSPAYAALSRRARGMAPEAPAQPSAPGITAETPSEVAAPSEAPAPSEARPPTGMLPAATTAAKAEAKKKEEVGIAESSVKEFEKAQTNKGLSTTMIGAAEGMISLVDANPDAFRIMSKPGVAQAIMRAANKGIQAGNFGSISIPVDELAGFKLNQKELDTLNLFANQLAIAKNANRKMARIPGEGATSDLESTMSNQMLELNNASPEAIKFINEFTILRARDSQLRYQILQNLRNKGLSVSDALASPEIQNLDTDYLAALRSLNQRNAALLSQKKVMRGTIKKSDSDVPEGYIRDPQTKVIRRKREGE